MGSAAMKNVLVVEDESVLRASMVAGLAKLPGVNVYGAPKLAEAIRTLDETAPDLVVSDIDLPDGLGVSLIGELLKRKLNVPVIFVTAYRAAYGALIPPHANVDVLEKPVSLDGLRGAVQRRLGGDELPASPFVVADYVQLSCMGRHSVTIHIEWREGQGKVEIVRGELWSATDPTGTGDAAFRRLAFKREAKIRCAASEADPGPRNLDGGWEAALMEAARLQDEEQRASRPAIDLGAPDVTREPPPPSRPPESSSFDRLVDQAIAALMAKDYRAAANALGQAHALRPDDAKVNANLKRLQDMGFSPEG